MANIVIRFVWKVNNFHMPLINCCHNYIHSIQIRTQTYTTCYKDNPLVCKYWLAAQSAVAARREWRKSLERKVQHVRKVRRFIGH